ncbi:MAG: Hydroxyethylthiazole kinase [Anaerosporomusa subterranea]|jgi:hydroxyethylthiazole kinase|nr:Hydroxyethylthiazole kinase [Anaerosporomusa subterranea]
MDILQTAAQALAAIRKSKPLIHHLTNYVTINDCANITLAIGASPVMANDPQEVEEMVSHAAALVINIGTLDATKVQSMIAAGKQANTLGIPVIFDPVGVGATSFRRQAAGEILQVVQPTVIRGNMSEIKTLAGLEAVTRGVDSTADTADGDQAAQTVAKKLNCVVTITGKIDLIVSNQGLYRIDNGHPLLANVTGTGCMATSLIACFCGVTTDYLASAVGGIAVMGIAGELAERSLKPGEGIGTFRVRLFDAVSNMTPELLLQHGRVSQR